MSFIVTSLYSNVPQSERMRPLPVLLVKQGRDYVVATKENMGRAEYYGAPISLRGSLYTGGNNRMKMDGVT